MKGQSKEIFELTIIVILIIFVVLTSLYFMRKPSITKQDVQIEERNLLYNSDSVKGIFYTELPGTEKTIAQILSDRIISQDDMIFYGEGYGYLDAKKIIEKYFTDYYGDRWNLTVLVVSREINPMWIPNANPLDVSRRSHGNSISKVSSDDGREMGRYYTVPEGVNGNPSRIALDSKGNVWIGNRNYNSVVKFGLSEKNGCIDKNSNGVIETSYDKNKDMIIDESEMMNFGQDECMLLNVILPKQKDAVYVRALCIDRNDNVYVGMYDDKVLFYIDGKTGSILNQVNLPYRPYGCFVDKHNIVWISTFDKNIMTFNPSSNTVNTINFDCTSYGIAPCTMDECMVVNCYNDKKILKLSTDPSSRGNRILEIKLDEYTGGKGIMVDNQDNIYAVFKTSNAIVKIDKNGNIKAVGDTCNGPHGVGIDSKGNVWVACEDTYMYKFDENLNYLVSSSFGSNHYVYNFFTDYNLKISKVDEVVNYGHKFTSEQTVRTFHMPLPVPGPYGMYAEVILYVW
ncbi:MAG: hypothetical protein QXM68_01345 [Candidatus Aenigmatarchaeota archaeon]|nr:hypothetical protein [Candidatus Aenigmarchaeota archaeon]